MLLQGNNIHKELYYQFDDSYASCSVQRLLWVIICSLCALLQSNNTYKELYYPMIL